MTSRFLHWLLSRTKKPVPLFLKCSTVPERCVRLVHATASADIERRAGIGANEDVRRHAGHEAEIAEPLDFRLGQRDANDVIGLARSRGARLITGKVGGNMTEHAVELGHGTPVA